MNMHFTYSKPRTKVVFIKILLLVQLIFQTLYGFEYLAAQITISVTSINTLAQYTFNLQRSFTPGLTSTTPWNTELVPTGSNIIVKFPAEFNLSASTIVCSSLLINFTPISGFTTAVNANNFTISNAVTANTAISNVLITLTDVTNPSPALTTGNFVVYIGNDVSADSTSASVTLTPATFTNCLIQFNPKFVNTTGRMLFQITPRNQIPSTGHIQIKFPTALQWVRDISTNHLIPINGTLNCFSLTANVQSSLVCSGLSSTQIVTVTGIFSTAVISSFGFSIDGIFSPPTTENIDQIIITSYQSTFALDSCTSKISNLLPKTITDLTLQGTAPLIVNNNVGLIFKFTSVDTVTRQDSVQIQFPSGSIVSFSTHFGTFILSSGSYNSTSGILGLNFSTTAGTVWSGTLITSTFVSYQVPGSVRPTNTITYRLLRNGFKKMEGTTSLTPIAMTYTASISSISKIVNEVTSYTVQFTLRDRLMSNGYIQVNVPTSLTLESNLTVTLSGSGSNLNPSPTFLAVNNTIKINNLNLTASTINSQNILIIIGNLRNPGNVQAISNFTFKTFLTADPIDQVATGSTNNALTLQPALINSTSVTLTSSSFRTAEKNVDYIVSFRNTNKIPINGIVKLYIPNQIIIPVSTTSCGIEVTSLAISRNESCLVSSNLTYQTIQIRISSQISSNASISFKLSGVTNPSTTKPTANIGIDTYTSSNAQIDTLAITNGAGITMNLPTLYQTLSLTRSSFKNAAQAAYTFNLKHTQALQNSAFVTIEFPTTIRLFSGTSVTCTNQNDQTLNCSVLTTSPLKIQVEMLSNISLNPSSYQYRIKVLNIKNPISYGPTGPFKFATFTKNKLYQYSGDSSTITAVTNTVSSNFGSLSHSFSSKVLGGKTNLSLTIQQQGTSDQFAHSLKVTFANSFTLQSNILCTSAQFTVQCSLTGRQLIINNAPNQLPKDFSIQFAGINVPKNIPSDYTKLQSFDGSNYLMSQNLNTITYIVQCNLPCKTCNPGNFSICLSCYDSSINSRVYLHEQTCLSTCPTRTFQYTGDFTCPSCASPCYQCENQALFCKSCDNATNFKYLNQTVNSVDNSITNSTCVSSCPSRMYPDSTQIPVKCVNCISPCQTCNSQTDCQTCVDGYFYYTANLKCETNCPAGVTITNTVRKTCDACSPQCQTCDTVITNCTSCASTAAFYNGTCVLQCPSPLVIHNGSCVNCDSTCKTCSITKSNCTSCANPLPFKSQFTCLLICPDFNYANAQKQCITCQSAKINCRNCSSATICLVCDSGYVLLNNACLNETPPGYLNISGKAQPCQGDCATCEVTLTNCTSCKTLFLANNSCLSTCTPGFLGLNKICQPCVLPCTLCIDTLNKCTECTQSGTASLYLREATGQCTEVCPNGTFPNSIKYVCDSCVDPCQTCTSTNICLTCKTGFLYGNDCLPTCNPGFVGINKKCESCQSPCKTCSNLRSNCTSCQATLYFNSVTFSCDPSCPSGLITNPTAMTCDPCDNACLTCQNSTTLCTSCKTNTFLYLKECLASCPSGMFGSSGICQNCSSSCRTCIKTANQCASCTPPLLLYQTSQSCITECPVTHSVIVNNVCTRCSAPNCANCSASDQCLQCYSPSIHFNNSCFSSCPQGYQYNGSTCITITQVANETLDQTLSEASIFPMPFTIVGVIVFVACFMSKLQNSNTYLIGIAYSLFGILQTLSIAYLFYTYFLLPQQQKDQIIQLLIIVTLGIIAGLNIISLFLQTCLLITDKKFSIWLSVCCNKCFFFGVTIVGFAVSYKIKLIMFTKLFHFLCCRGQLQSVQGFRVFNVLSFLGLGHAGLIIYVCVISLIKMNGVISNVFFIITDVLVIAFLNIILALAAAKKDDDFFEQTQEGLKINKQEIVQQDAINQTPLKDDDHTYYYSSVKKIRQGVGYDSQDIINEDLLQDDDLSLSISQNRDPYQATNRVQNNQTSRAENNIFNEGDQNEHSSNSLNKSGMNEGLMIQSMMEYQSQAIGIGGIGKKTLAPIDLEDGLTQYNHGSPDTGNLVQTKSRSKLKPQNVHQSPKKKAKAESNVAEFGTQDGLDTKGKNGFKRSDQKQKQDKYRKQVALKNMTTIHVRNKQKPQQENGLDKTNQLDQHSAAELNIKMKKQINERKRKQQQQIERQLEQKKRKQEEQIRRKQELLKAKLEQQRIKQQQYEKHLQEQRVKSLQQKLRKQQQQQKQKRKQQQDRRKQQQRMQERRKQQQRMQKQRILQQLLQKKRIQDEQKERQRMLNKQIIDQDDILEDRNQDQLNDSNLQKQKQKPLHSNVNLIEVRDTELDKQKEEDQIEEISLVKNMKPSPMTQQKGQTKIPQEIDQQKRSWIENDRKDKKAKNQFKQYIVSNEQIDQSESFEDIDNRKGTLSEIQEENIKSTNNQENRYPMQKHNGNELPSESDKKEEEREKSYQDLLKSRSQKQSQENIANIDKSIDNSFSNPFNDNTLPLDAHFKRYPNQQSQEKQQSKTKKNFDFSQVYQSKQQQKYEKRHESQNIGLESSQPEDDDQINHHPIKAKHRKQEILLQIVQQADRKRKGNQQNGYYKIGNLVKNQDSKAATTKDFGQFKKQYSQRDAQSRDQTARENYKKNQRPPRPMTTDKNRLYMAGLNNLGENSYTRKSGIYPQTQNIRKESHEGSQASSYIYQNQKRNKSLNNTPFKKASSKEISEIEDMEFRHLGISPSQYDHLNQRYIVSTVNVETSLGPGNQLPQKPRIGTARGNYQQIQTGTNSKNNNNGSINSSSNGNLNRNKRSSEKTNEREQVNNISKNPIYPNRLQSRGSQLDEDMREYYNGERELSKSRSKSKQKMNEKSMQRMKQLQKIYLQRLDTPKKRPK